MKRGTTSVVQATYMMALQRSLVPPMNTEPMKVVGRIAATGHLPVKVASLLLLQVQALPNLILLVHRAEQHVDVLHGGDVGSLLAVDEAAAEQGVDLHPGGCTHLIFIIRQHLQQSQLHERRGLSCKTCSF